MIPICYTLTSLIGNCLFWRKNLAYVSLREGEEPEVLLKRFQTQMQRSGILRELRNRRFFRSKGEQERLDRQRGIRRLRRRRTRS
ncbi:MAG: 30S ribosomal protein S21 [Chloroflexi bacterium]|nr:MAG: 30S ribosomal protein S21 [SAR202 cluster bacterium]MAO75061.1 30S ribosomal protein S21 [Chloroflexota bacterium]MBG54523.1 30S ribosomal protein S21 [Chloroflexota bacterium]